LLDFSNHLTIFPNKTLSFIAGVFQVSCSNFAVDTSSFSEALKGESIEEAMGGRDSSYEESYGGFSTSHGVSRDREPEVSRDREPEENPSFREDKSNSYESSLSRDSE